MDGGPTDEDCVDEDKLDDKDEDAEGTLAERTGALGSLSVVIMDGVAKPKLRARGRRTKANLKPVQVEGVGESPAAAASIVCPLTFALKWASRFPAATTLPVSFISACPAGLAYAPAGALCLEFLAYVDFGAMSQRKTPSSSWMLQNNLVYLNSQALQFHSTCSSVIERCLRDWINSQADS